VLTAEAVESKACTYRSSAALVGASGALSEETRKWETQLTSTADVDIDGSFSVDSQSGGSNALASLLLPTPHDFAVELSLALADDERLRCLLLYADSALADVLLLREVKADADGGVRVPAPVEACTLISLLGDWRGDACVRQPMPLRPPVRAKGFSTQSKQVTAELSQQETGFGEASINIYKSTVTYIWDGQERVARKLEITSFGGQALEPIVSMGVLSLKSGPAGTEFESVAFSSAGDPTAPRMLLLPEGSFVLAPTRLVGGQAPFTVEFGAVLEGAEGFGLMGFHESGDESAGAADDAELDPLTAAMGDPTAERMVRVQRLYNTGLSFVSGTTSLCTQI